MFKSYEYIRYIPDTDEYEYKIIDDEWEETAISAFVARSGPTSGAAATIKAYSKRNYSIDDIGLNLALFCIYYKETYNYSTIKVIIQWQDTYIPIYNKDIKNYKEIAAARDKHLPTLYLYS